MNFSTKITEEKNIITDICDELSNSKFPNFLYGAGVASKKILPVLIERGVLIEAVVVDAIYSENVKDILGYPVIALEEKLALHDKVNIFVSFACDQKNVENKLMETGKVAKVLFFDCNCDRLMIENFTNEYIKENFLYLSTLYNTLEDTLSKETFIAFINQRISGKLDYVKKITRPCQYFPEEIVDFTNNEIFVDCGAYDGDTALEFIGMLKAKGLDSYSKIFAFEPDEASFKKLNLLQKELHDFYPIKKGTFSRKEKIRFASEGSVASNISLDGRMEIEVDALDNLLEDEKVTFIKMDIEGSELASLRGAQNIIRKYRPMLAISIYHKYDDLITIPSYIQSIAPEYRLWIRAHSSDSSEVVLYAKKGDVKI